jgi:hypothetical protein
MWSGTMIVVTGATCHAGRAVVCAEGRYSQVSEDFTAIPVVRQIA